MLGLSDDEAIHRDLAVLDQRIRALEREIANEQHPGDTVKLQTLEKQKTGRMGRDPQIIVASIALVGTLASAVFGYLGIREQGRGQAQPPVPSPASVLPTITAPTEPAVLPASTPAQPSVTPTNAAENWEAVIQITSSDGPVGCHPLVLPSYITPAQDAFKAAEQVGRAAASTEIELWKRVPTYLFTGAYDPAFQRFPGDADFSYQITVTSIAPERDWLKINSTVVTTIVPETTAKHVDIVTNTAWGCGAAGKIRVFSPIDFKSEFQQYDATSSYAEADFFTLQPGEFEILQFPFQCAAPGNYTIQLAIPFTNNDEDGVIHQKSRLEYTCPETFTLWKPLQEFAGMTKIGDYVWADGTYVQVPSN